MCIRDSSYIRSTVAYKGWHSWNESWLNLQCNAIIKSIVTYYRCWFFKGIRLCEHLSSKLKAHGIRDPLLSWVRSFLTNRHQHVVLGGRYPFWTSSLCEVHVPKRTVLRPILFLIYKNDITWKIESQCKLFADEMKVYMVLRNVHKDTQILQNNLNTLEQWLSLIHIWRCRRS